MDVIMNFTVANGRPDQDWPDPGNGKRVLAHGCGWNGQAGDDDPGHDGIPPPALSLEQKFYFSNKDIEETESLSGFVERS